MSDTTSKAEQTHQEKADDMNKALKFLINHNPLMKAYVERQQKEHMMDFPCMIATAMADYATLVASERMTKEGEQMFRQEFTDCPLCNGTKKVKSFSFVDGKETLEYCKTCKSTGKIMEYVPVSPPAAVEKETKYFDLAFWGWIGKNYGQLESGMFVALVGDDSLSGYREYDISELHKIWLSSPTH
jgi:transcription elongation factor Elf1